MEELVTILKRKNKTIAAMESCTGGGFANAVTNIEGCSDVIKYSAVTYSNEYKIKMGVSKKVIDEYSVYSIETAKEMSKAISLFANSNYGIGITGKLNRFDKNNLYGENNKVFISIYDNDDNKFYTNEINVTKETRDSNKELVINEIVDMLKEILVKE